MLITNNTGIPAWDFALKKWIGDGDWRIALLAMD
jgi:hypothetical protein